MKCFINHSLSNLFIVMSGMILIIFKWLIDIVYIHKHYMDGRNKVATNFY